MTIWYIFYSLGTFFRFWYHVPRKIWQPLSIDRQRRRLLSTKKLQFTHYVQKTLNVDFDDPGIQQKAKNVWLGTPIYGGVETETTKNPVYVDLCKWYTDNISKEDISNEKMLKEDISKIYISKEYILNISIYRKNKCQKKIYRMGSYG
jgi:hypothetical protein